MAGPSPDGTVIRPFVEKRSGIATLSEIVELAVLVRIIDVLACFEISRDSDVGIE